MYRDAAQMDAEGNIVSTAQKEFTQYFPKPGWVEHDPMEIWSTQAGIAAEALVKKGLNGTNVAAIGITNQRETVVVWDKKTGEPVYNAIVWQDKRTAEYCDELKAQGKSDLIREKTGLVIDTRREPLLPAKYLLPESRETNKPHYLVKCALNRGW